MVIIIVINIHFLSSIFVYYRRRDPWTRIEMMLGNKYNG